MALPVISFAPTNIERKSSFLPAANSVSSLIAQALQNQMQMQKNKFAPETMQAELDAQKLANELSKIDVRYKPGKYETEIAEGKARIPLMSSETQKNLAMIPYLKAQAAMEDFKQKNPLLFSTGLAGQLGSMIYLQELEKAKGNQPSMPSRQIPQQPPALPSQLQAIVNPLAQALGVRQSAPSLPVQQQAPMKLSEMLEQGLRTEIQRKNALADWAITRNQGYNFATLPADSKRATLAQTRALGYNDIEARRLIDRGASIQDMAAARGFDANNMPAPNYLPQMAALNQMQRANVVTAGIDAVNNDITDAFSQFSRRFAGVSPSAMKDMIKGENPQKIGRLLAASAMQPEIQSLRIRALGGQVGVTAIDEMIKSSQSNLNTLGLSPNSETYKVMQQQMHKWIKKIREAENKATLGYQAQIDSMEDNQSQAQQQTDEKSIEAAWSALGGEE